MAFHTRSTNYLDVDMSDLREVISRVKSTHTPENYRLILIRALRRAESSTRTIISKEIREDYAVPARWIRGQIGNAKIGFGGSFGDDVHCAIPIDGARGVHGNQFKLSATKGRGRPTKAAAGKRYKIYSKVIKGKISELPEKMKNQGGNAPFIGPSGIVFTRKTKERLPIVRVVGEGVPQMPLNRSREDIQASIMEKLAERIEHEHKYMIQQIAKRTGR